MHSLPRLREAKRGAEHCGTGTSTSRAYPRSKKELQRPLDVATRELQHGLALRIVKAHHHQALNRGVRIDWLLSFTMLHDCWSWPTWLVVQVGGYTLR